MYASNCSVEDLKEALELTTKEFDNNVIFNRFPEARGNRLMFTLKVKDSSGEGARVSDSGRKMVSACWHVHGTFFDNLIKVNSEAEIKSAQSIINSDGGNWRDWQAGSFVNPKMASELCNC
jgi:hypothetical protein